MVKRKKLTIIFPKFQITLILVNLITSLACLSAVLIQNSLAFKAMRELGRQYNLADTQPYFRFLEIQQEAFLKYLLVSFVIAFSISLVATLLYSHRVAGPLVRLKNFFMEIKSTGKLPSSPLRFRKNDYLHELAETIQEGLEKINQPKN